MNNNLKDFRWSSHIPMCKSVLSVFSITGVLELGSGFNSTPLFFESCQNVISIENDKNWIDHLKKVLTTNKNHQIIYHELENQNITRSTKPWEVDDNIKQLALTFYQYHNNSNLNLLFIDCYSCFRLTALQNLYSTFDIIIFHDIHESHYDYNKLVLNSKSYICLLDFSFFTGVLIRDIFYKKYINIFKDKYKMFSSEHSKKYMVEIISNLKEDDITSIPSSRK